MARLERQKILIITMDGTALIGVGEAIQVFCSYPRDDLSILGNVWHYKKRKVLDQLEFASSAASVSAKLMNTFVIPL